MKHGVYRTYVARCDYGQSWRRFALSGLHSGECLLVLLIRL